jgi:hypothetical protein
MTFNAFITLVLLAMILGVADYTAPTNNNGE